ncbi:MAG: hypothetical protein DDT19_01740 [Syntrophomonadaceae bacterium]|nr:hypothetical protein [Bacillota bacterium]
MTITGTTMTAAGGGTVTSVTSANADATVATTTTTPVITIVSAPRLTTARTVAGVPFDGTVNIAIPASGLSNGVTGSGAVVLATSPTLVTPLLGTPTSGTLTNCTGLPVAGGGTGASTAQAAINALSAVAPATNEHVLTKDTATGNAVFKAAAGGGAVVTDKLTTADVFSDFVVSGLLSPTSANLSSTLAAGAAYVLGTRVTVAATPFTYTASQDTYVDLSNAGVLTYVAVANGAAAPALTANSLRLQRVVTNATAVTAVTRLAVLRPFAVALNGNVGIGTTNLGERLEVVGNIISKGTSWTPRTSAADNNWYSVTYGNGLFVAVAFSGTGNRVMTSPDGINWTLRTSAADNAWVSVTYGNGLFVAVAQSGTGNRVMTSPDGITWTARTSAADNNWNSVTYGNGTFVAVAFSGSGNRVMTSPDGITWTARTSAADNNWYSVTYGNDLFVAVAIFGGGNGVMTSPDSINWTLRTSAADNQWYSVTYGNGLFVAVAHTGTGNRVMTSPDGINWTLRTSAADNAWVSVTYGNGLFVAVAQSGTGNGVMTSPDGITWTLRTSAADNQWYSVTYGNGLFVAVAHTGTGNRVMTSGKTDYIPFSANNIYQGGMNIFGNVGIGTASPGAQLDLSTDSARKLTTTTWTTGSDIRIKTNVQSISDALDIISRTRPAKFNYTPEFLAAHPSVKDTDYYNFIAQEYQQVFPNSVTETDGLLYLNTSNMIPYAIAGIKELDERTRGIGLMDKRIKKLERENAELKSRLEALEKFSGNAPALR